LRASIAATVLDSGPANGRNRAAPKRRPPTEGEIGQSQCQQGCPDPQQRRSGEGPIAHRQRGHPLRREHQGVPGAAGDLVDGERRGQREEVDPGQPPQRTPGAADRGAGSGRRREPQITQGGSENGDRRQHHTRRGGREQPGQGHRRPHHHALDDDAGPGADHTADQPHRHRLGPGHSGELPATGTAGAQQPQLLATTCRPAGGDHRGKDRGQRDTGQTQEQKQHLRIQGVLAGRVEGGVEVVPHQCGAGEGCLEVAGAADVGSVGGGRIRGQIPVPADMHLRTHHRRIVPLPGGEEGVELRDRQQQHIVRGCLRRRGGRGGDGLEQ
jgi:hypothetical protein